MDNYFMKKPCKHCPFSRNTKPFLTAERGEELAYHAENPNNTFPCHKTTESDEYSEDGNSIRVENSKECAGFLTMQISINGEEFKPEGFEPDYEKCYEDAWEMSDAYDN